LDVSYFQGDKIDSDSFCWGTSDLHNWLNTEFYSTAFDSEEQNQIRPMHIVKGDISTDDNVFILSKLEMENYISSKEDRIVSPTRYAYNLGLEVDPSQKSEFWLRTVADLDESYVYKKIDTVAADGQLAYEDVAYKLCGVRPALWITLNNSNISEPIECPFDEPEDYVAPSAYVTERTSLEIGENVFFGTFPYSFNGKSLPKGEDIPWRVSEQNGDEYLLTSNYGFSPDQDELENVFYFDAFNKTEQHMIVTQTDSDGNAYDLKFSSSGTSIEVWVKLN
jgi:hypothetical protein